LAHVYRKYAQLLEKGKLAWLIEQELLKTSNSASACIGTSLHHIEGPWVAGLIKGARDSACSLPGFHIRYQTGA